MKHFNFSLRYKKISFPDKYKKLFVFSGNCNKLFWFGKFGFLGQA